MAGREVRNLEWVRKTSCTIGGRNVQYDKMTRNARGLKLAENGFWLIASKEMGTSAL